MFLNLVSLFNIMKKACLPIFPNVAFMRRVSCGSPGAQRDAVAAEMAGLTGTEQLLHTEDHNTTAPQLLGHRFMNINP